MKHIYIVNNIVPGNDRMVLGNLTPSLICTSLKTAISKLKEQCQKEAEESDWNVSFIDDTNSKVSKIHTFDPEVGEWEIEEVPSLSDVDLWKYEGCYIIFDCEIDK